MYWIILYVAIILLIVVPPLLYFSALAARTGFLRANERFKKNNET